MLIEAGPPGVEFADADDVAPVRGIGGFGLERRAGSVGHVRVPISFGGEIEEEHQIEHYNPGQ